MDDAQVRAVGLKLKLALQLQDQQRDGDFFYLRLTCTFSHKCSVPQARSEFSCN